MDKYKSLSNLPTIFSLVSPMKPAINSSIKLLHYIAI